MPHTASIPDPLTPRLREIESEIDRKPLQNAILGLQRNVAIAHLLDYVTRTSLNAVPGETTWIETAKLWDATAPGLQEALAWILDEQIVGHRRPDAAWPLERNPLLEFDARRLLNAGINYASFRRLFMYASEGDYAVRIEGNQLVRDAVAGKPYDPRYSVYLHLAQSRRMSQGWEDAIVLNRKVADSCRPRSDGGYELLRERQLYSIAFTFLHKRQTHFSTIPRNWAFKRYNFDELMRVGTALSGIGAVHHAALVRASRARYAAPAWMFWHKESDHLLHDVSQIAGIEKSVCSQILADLTLGGRGLKRPDISLQPLVPLGDGRLGVVPFQILNLWWERNLLVLLNKFPEEQAVYSVLKNEKAERMRLAIERVLQGRTTAFQGRISARKDLPDVDLAIRCHQSRTCLVLELKWFIAPGEPREAINRSKELDKAFGQLTKLRQIIRTDATARSRMGIDESWDVRYSVVCAHWIGFEFDQHPDFPIIRVDHLQNHLKKSPDLRSTCDWLDSRSYLPIEGQHFVNTGLKRTSRIGEWTMIEPSFRLLNKSIDFEHTPYD